MVAASIASGLCAVVCRRSVLNGLAAGAENACAADDEAAVLAPTREVLDAPTELAAPAWPAVVPDVPLNRATLVAIPLRSLSSRVRASTKPRRRLVAKSCLAS